MSPPAVAYLEKNDTHLSFNLSQASYFNCPPYAFQYQIIPNDCGECSTTTGSNVVTCSGDYTQLTRDTSCSVAVQTVMCDDLVGNISIMVTVPISGIHMHAYYSYTKT